MDHPERRANEEVNRKLLNILDYFDLHKEEIINGLTAGVKVRELIAAGVIFGSVIMGMNVFILNQHSEHPHKGAVHKDEFHRANELTHSHLVRLEEKLDRIIESGALNGGKP